MRLVDQAIEYARLGWPVIPLHTPTRGRCSCNDPECEHIGKHPRHGATWQQSATLHINAIRDYWHRWPTANVGLRTGAAAGMFVLDSDEGGAATIAKYGGVPTTPRAQTGSGGDHFYLLYPGKCIRNHTKILPGLDIRGDGGLIVAPPSLHKSGNRYEWTTPPDTQIAPAPAWLIEALDNHERRHMPTHQADAPHGANNQGFPQRRGEAYALKALGDEATLVRERKTDRNTSLYLSAQRLGRFVGGGYLEADQVADALYEAARASGLRPNEIYGAIQRGITNGKKHPKEIEPAKYQGVDLPGNIASNSEEISQLAPPKSAMLLSATPSPTRASAPPVPPAPPAAPPAADEEGDPHTSDMGNATRFARLHGQRVRYVPQWESWLMWDGTRWQADEVLEIQRMARATVRSIYREAADTDDTSRRKDTAKWALQSEEEKRLRNMIKLAQSEDGITISANTIDPDHYLLNCTNGTLDLKTGKLQPHNQTDLITRRVNVDYNPAATCPQWEQFLHRIFQNDQELITYVQRGIGYTLTGSVQEQCLFFAYGTGRNGKSTLFETVMKLLGDYAQKAPNELIMQKYEGGGGASNHIARLKGMRMVVTAEIEEGKRLSEALVKDLTGDDTITARYLYKEHFEFKPTHKLWIYGNHKPEIRGTDPGIWRRIRVIPFDVQIPKNEIDYQLKDKLAGELEGILAWAVRGCMEHQREGLNEPRAVIRATQEYRNQQDVLAAYFDECCVLKQGLKVPVSDLYTSYKTWCEDNGERPMTQRRLAGKLNERGFDLMRTGAKGAWYRFGIGLLDPDQVIEPDDTDPTDPTGSFSVNPLINQPHEPILPKNTTLDQLDQWEEKEVGAPAPPAAAGNLDAAALAATAEDDEEYAALATTAEDDDAAPASILEPDDRLPNGLRRSSAAVFVGRKKES